MASTSETPKQYDPLEQVTPYFNRAQIYAFQQPPSPEAMRKVNRGGSHDYIPHEYIRALLDRFIGPGRWELKAVVHSVDKEIVKKGGKEQVAATAIVNVELSILAKENPEMRLTYAGVGSHTMYANIDQGFGSVIGNAIDSAESDGVKAAAKNLGKAFGFDLKGKLNRDALPPSIQAYAKILADKNRSAEATAVPPEAAEPAPVQAAQPMRQTSDKGAEPAARQERSNETRSAPRQEAEQERHDAPRSNDRRHADAEQAPRREKAEERREEVREEPRASRRDEPREERQQTRERRPEPAEQAARAPANDAAREGDARERGAPEGRSSDDDQNRQADEKPVARVWELSMDPGNNYDDWIACIQTMASRINAMTSSREIESFVKRYNKRIKDLPQIPADGENKAKDFKRHFRRIVAKKYQTLGLEVPEQYAEPAAVAA